MAKRTKAANRSLMSHQFSQVPQAKIQRSSFDRSHGHKTTFDAGYLVPVFVDEVLPGDTFNLRMTAFARLATPIKPLMDNIFFDTFFFFVPNRLVWDNWQKLNGEQDNPGDSTDYVLPVLAGTEAVTENTLQDYFGLPLGLVPDTTDVNALPFRGYHLIYNEWFRDQNLQNSLTVPKGDGPDPISDYALIRRGKRHDYFTSSLPFPQKGESPSVPLGDLAPITGLGITATQAGTPRANVRESDGSTNAYDFGQDSVTVGLTYKLKDGNTNPFPDIYADLSQATGFTINQLRQSFQIQKLLERDARGGSRYTEIIRSHFGVVSPDARLQRPEFLGGGTSMVNINPVAQTSGTAVQDGYTPTPQGNLSAFGTVSAQGHGFVKSFTEHGYIIGLANIRADLTYQQGLNRMWSRQGRYDFYWPALAHIGEQAVLSKEIYVDGTAGDDSVWGYQERFAEYRYMPSRISGSFRSNASAPLDVWHLSQDFAERPTLGASFIEDNPPIARVISVPTEPHFLADFYFRLRCARPMPLYGVPGLIDHF